MLDLNFGKEKKFYVECLGSLIYFNIKIVIFYLILYCYVGKWMN